MLVECYLLKTFYKWMCSIFCGRQKMIIVLYFFWTEGVFYFWKYWLVKIFQINNRGGEKYWNTARTFTKISIFWYTTIFSTVTVSIFIYCGILWYTEYSVYTVDSIYRSIPNPRCIQKNRHMLKYYIRVLITAYITLYLILYFIYKIELKR